MTKPRTEEEWDVFRRQIETQIEEYEHAVRDAEAWWRAYQERNKGFRAMRRKAAND